LKPSGAFSFFSTDHFEFLYKESAGKENTYLFRISKKYHHAVERNYLKRRIREFFRADNPLRTYLIKIFLLKRMDLTDKNVLLEELNALFTRLT
jgi:ribonuclease P protein component